MSAEATAWVWAHSPLKGTAFTIHLAIADVVNDMHQNRFWATAETLAAKARTSREQISRTLKELRALGLIEFLDEESVDRRKSRHQGREFRLLMPTESDVTRDHIAPESDVTRDHIHDVTNDHIQGTQERTQTKEPLLSARADESASTDLVVAPSSQPSEVPVEDPNAARIADIHDVFEVWIDVFRSNAPRRPKLTAERRKHINARLDDGYTVLELCDAIRGASLDSFYMGQNDRGKVFDDIPNLLRQGSRVERFRDLWYEGGERGPVDAVDQYMAMTDDLPALSFGARVPA